MTDFDIVREIVCTIIEDNKELRPLRVLGRLMKHPARTDMHPLRFHNLQRAILIESYKLYEGDAILDYLNAVETKLEGLNAK